MGQSGRSCRKAARASREPLEIELAGGEVHVRSGRRLLRTLSGRDAAVARELIDDPVRLDHFLRARVTR